MKSMNKKVIRILIISFVVVMLIVGISSCRKPKLPSFNYPDANLVQLESPKTGDEIATIKTNLGEFSMVLYREYAPKTVEHFVKLANDGHYNNTYIYRVGKPMFFFAGTKNKDGMIVKEGDVNFTEAILEIETTKIPVETTPDLWLFKGAIVSLGPDLGYDANTKKYSAGTFMLGVNTDKYTDEVIKLLNKEKEKEGTNDAIIDAFIEKGGNPFLDHINHYTIFAQVYDGWETYDKIFAAEIDEDKNSAPKEDIIIESITISKFGE